MANGAIKKIKENFFSIRRKSNEDKSDESDLDTNNKVSFIPSSNLQQSKSVLQFDESSQQPLLLFGSPTQQGYSNAERIHSPIALAVVLAGGFFSPGLSLSNESMQNVGKEEAELSGESYAMQGD